jgi:hypothetical protein
MERHTDTKKLPETIKVPLQSVTKTGKTAFAYMRRSTTKKEQASSLPQQEEGIEYIAKNLWMEIGSIRSYVESRSGFENRSRKEWQKMLEEIDKQNEPCIILCRDTSRLSRNPTDNLAIANRMFWDNKQKKVIQSIYFLGTGMIVDEWNEKTNKKHIVDTLHQNYTDSMENKEKCIAWVLLKLEQGEFPYCPPHGLSRVNRDGMKRTSRNEKTTLKQNEKMPFVRQAFEMKAKGRTAKEICKYLKQYGGVNISWKNIVETIIANTVYMGVYTEKTTGSVFENIKFWEWKPPIDADLWERANAKVGKKGSGFGQLQSEHIAPWILKHESGKNLYLYKAKGKYNAYQTEVKGENGARKSIGMMESQIVKKFLDEVIPRIRKIYGIFWAKNEYQNIIERQKQRRSLSDYNIDSMTEQDIWFEVELYFDDKDYTQYDIKKFLDMTEKEIEKWRNCIFLDDDEGMTEMEKDKHFVEEMLKTDIYYENLLIKRDVAKKMLKDLLITDTTIQEREIRDQQRKALEQKKQTLEEEKTQIDKKAFKLWYSAELANTMKEDTENEIQAIKEQMDALSESTDMEQYLDRLPEIVRNLHELASRVLPEADYEGARDDIRQLIEIVSHELILTNKKELQIRLFDVLEELEIDEMWNGARDRDRTCDLELRRLLLYPTELLGQGSMYVMTCICITRCIYSRTVGIIWKIGGKRGEFWQNS